MTTDEAAARPGRDRWILGLCLALLITVPAWLPWLHPQVNLWQGDPGVDDAKNHMQRLYMLDWLLARGVWYPRWMPDLFLGFGYPVLNYYAPGFYYLALLHKWLLRLDIWDAFRVTGVAAVLLGAAGTYALVVGVWRRVLVGVLAALCLVYFPYAFQANLWKRGDIPEMLGLALIPWLLLALWRLWHATGGAHTTRWVLAAAGAGAAEILTHNLTALMAAALAAVWLAVLVARRPSARRLGMVALAGGMAVGSSAFFWLPAIAEGGAVQLEWLRDEGLDYTRWFVHPGGTSDRESFRENRQTRIGVLDLHLRYPHELVAPPRASLAQAAIALLTAGAIAFGLLTRRPVGPSLALLACGAVCWFLTLSVSAPVWQSVPGMPYLQFPWRFMGLLAVCLSIAFAGALALLLTLLERHRPAGGRLAGIAAVLLLGGGVVANSLGARALPLTESELPVRTVDGQLLRRDELTDALSMGTTSGREFLPRDVHLAVYTRGAPRGGWIFEYLYPERDWTGGLFYPMAGELRFVSWRSGPLWISAQVANDSGGPAALGVRQIRFPGWQAWLDGQSVPIGAAPTVPEQQATPGFMVISVPPGEHTVGLAFGPTPVRVAGMAITLVTLFVAVGTIGRLVTAQRHEARRVVVAGVLAAALGLAYLGWRGVRPLFARDTLPSPSAPVTQGSIWQAPPFRPHEAGLLVNVAEAVRTGRARVESPTGAQLGSGQFVDVRYLTVTDRDAPERGAAGTSRRQWLYLHPPATVTVDVSLPRGRRIWLQSALALDPGAWDAPVGDGVRYQAIVTALDGAGQSGGPAIVLDEVVNPRARPEHRRWVPVAADLSAWAGTTIRLTLKTLARDDSAYDWAGWANPVVVVRETPRADLPTI